MLIISSYFAPSAAVGAKRFSFLVREFTAQGAHAEVLALGSQDGQMDYTLPLADNVIRITPLLRFPPKGI